MKANKSIIIIPLIVLFLANSVYAWNLVNQSGYWKILTKEHFIKEGWNDGYAEWNHIQTGFNGYWLKIDFTTWENWREWYQIGILSIGETSNDFWIKLKIQTSTATLWLVTKAHGYTSYVGALQGRYYSLGVSLNASKWEDVKLENPLFEGYDYWSVRQWQPSTFQIFIRNEGSKIKVYWLFDIPNQNNKYAFIKELNGTLGSSAVLTLIYQHGGQGKIEGYAVDSFILPSLPPYETKGQSTGGFLDVFNWLASLDYYGIVSTLMVCITIFFSFVKFSIPLLGIFALFWILDTVITSIRTGNLHLIGDMMMQIYDFVRGVWQTLVNIAQAIWDFITFWT